MNVRDHLIEALRAELVGPYDASGQETLRLAPSRAYLCGFLAPPEVEPALSGGSHADSDAESPADSRAEAESGSDPAPGEAALDGDEDFAAGSEETRDDNSTPDPEPAVRKVFPASVGLSVLLPAGAPGLRARLRWGEYRRVRVDPQTGALIEPEGSRASKGSKGKKEKKKIRGVIAWRRVPIDWIEVDVPLDPESIARGIEVADRVWLQGRLADAGQGDGSQALALFLVNRRLLSDTRVHRDETLLCQVEYQLCCSDGSFFLPRPDLSGLGCADLDDRIGDLQYRDSFEYVVGHGVAARPVLPEPAADSGADSKTDSKTDQATIHGAAQGAVKGTGALADAEAAKKTERATEPQENAGKEEKKVGVGTVEIAWIPQGEFRKVIAREDAPVVVSMEALGHLKTVVAIEEALGGLPQAYEAWIDSELADEFGPAARLSAERAETLELLVTRARTAARRIRDGIALLKSDKQVRQAFVFANRAMFFQARNRGRRAQQSWAENPEWRLFQLAFVLLSLADIAHPLGREGSPCFRDEVDLIFFPTGGGKTEAYLGLIAFTLVLRRLRGRRQTDGGEGVAVILRYTLRLLTLDQLERAATLVCALETMRVRDKYRRVLGDRRFEIGLWVGSKASANQMRHFKESLNAFRAGSGGNPCPLQLCPWCGEALDAKSLKVETTAAGLERAIVRCHSKECDFSKEPHSRAGLPIQFVDEQIYRDLPCFLLATVDKFAMLPWRGETGLLFGRVSHRDAGAGGTGSYYGPGSPTAIPRGAQALEQGLLPPELIVQDELHLISGPLGTMVGLFETAIEELCTREIDGRRLRPKIIAATATVRRAQRQVQALYGRRDTNLFPPQGLDPFETWFSEVQYSKPGRVYVGVAAGGRAMKRVLLRIYLTLLGAAKYAEGRGGASIEEVDGYMTLVGYFNSLRELGGMRRLVEDDIATRARKQEDVGPLDAVGPHHWVANRRIGLPEELTSRVSTAGIAKIKNRAATPHSSKRAALDVLLASNMISVGIDISRLGVMVVAGQPKTSAEYIQASSRVGRADWPGLVVTAYNIYRPRDRSHYEHFVAYHDSFYRQVEATSVTPFSAPAIDRGLAALVVALARLTDTEMTASSEAMNAEGLQAASQRILEVVQRRAANQPAVGASGEAAGDAFARTVRDRTESLINCWLSMIREYKDNSAHLHYSSFDRPHGQGRPLLRTALEVQLPDPDSHSMLSSAEKRFRAPMSMRDVEPSVHVWRRYKLGK